MNAVGVYERPLRYELAECPRCGGGPHEFTLALTVSKRVATFGGRSPRERQFDVALTCPTTHEVFEQSITLTEPADETLQAVAVATEPIEAPQWLSDERAEWLKNSAATARSFVQTMLSTSLGAIPIYFAVLKYVDSDNRVSAWLGIIPPVLFIAAAGGYAFALRPAFGRIGDVEEFLSFREKRLSELNERITVATAIFATGLALTVLVLSLGLYRS